MAEKTIAQLFDLSGKVALVTGGALGIGQGIAFRLAEAGASVVITDINLEAATQTVSEIKARGGKALAITANAASVDDAKKAVKAAVDNFGSLDSLVNNAGVFPMSPALQLTEELWDKVIDINLKGTFFYAQAAAETMIALERSGKIVNIASIDALHPTGNLVHYDASKGGVVMVTKSLALELAKHNITVNAIAPGSIGTPGAAAISEGVLKATGMSVEQLMTNFTARIPLGRAGVPDDIAKAVLFLVSEAADYITGSLLVVDGGYLLS
jgi:2-deoxy-D-gluconate 3-dehydrogenase